MSHNHIIYQTTEIADGMPYRGSILHKPQHYADGQPIEDGDGVEWEDEFHSVRGMGGCLYLVNQPQTVKRIIGIPPVMPGDLKRMGR